MSSRLDPSASRTLEIPAAGADALWQLPRAELRERALFHGTCEPFDAPLAPSGLDGVVWTVAGIPAIAQTYIPAAGLTAYLHVPYAYELADAVRPDDLRETLLVQMGRPAAHITRDAGGRASSWGATAGDMARNADLVAYIEATLGYAATDRGVWPLKLLRDPSLPGGFRVMPASYRKPGRLFVVLPQVPLRLYDHAAGHESDMTDLEYHHRDVFYAAEAAGFDGIRINDFCQSPSEGNLPHRSIGLFSAGLAKCQERSIPATHHDVGTDLHRRETDAFVVGHREAVCAAIAAGAAVPAAVLAEYPELRPPVPRRVRTAR